MGKKETLNVPGLESSLEHVLELLRFFVAWVPATSHESLLPLLGCRQVLEETVKMGP